MNMVETWTRFFFIFSAKETEWKCVASQRALFVVLYYVIFYLVKLSDRPSATQWRVSLGAVKTYGIN